MASSITHRHFAIQRLVTRRALIFEVSLATVAYLAYFFVRGLTESGFDQAADNADLLIRFEQWAGLYHEHSVQDAIDGRDWLVNVANWVYIWGHWPVIIVVGTWLLRTHPTEYRVLRNSFLISGGVGLFVFALFPVVPPRLLELGLVDTVTERSYAYRVLQPPGFTNQYAAMPSLHFGWDLLIGITLVRHAKLPALRVIGVALPTAMAWAVVATANHYIIDAIAGAALSLFGLWLATIAARRFDLWQDRIQSVGMRVARIDREPT